MAESVSRMTSRAAIDAVLTHYRDRGIIDWTDIPGHYERLGFETCCSYEPVQRTLA
ncbi:hypothetical protein [Halorhabdus salina]|uniref:hypothetical protein n=1 Tax=Halorhabdus salina TaxID=2750670 RepID=UPI0015EEC859|nr:hypothetical protein [Halorhabdus salina]